MLGLALDSAGQQASAAIWTGAASTSFALLDDRELPPDEGKADQLILVVEQLLETTGLKYQDLDVIAVNRGPGSFTGIRSAVALGRGLALATGCPVIGVTTHEALAATFGPVDDASLRRRPRRLIVQDARRGQVYSQCFDANLKPIDELRVETPEVAAECLRDGQWLLFGSGASLVQECLDDAADVTSVDDACLDARAVAMAAAARLSGGEAPIPGFDLTPLYIRPPDAVRPKPLVSPSERSVEMGA